MRTLPSTCPFLSSSFSWDDRTLLFELHQLPTEASIASYESGYSTDLLCGKSSLLNLLTDISGGGVEATISLGDNSYSGIGFVLLLLAFEV